VDSLRLGLQKVTPRWVYHIRKTFEPLPPSPEIQPPPPRSKKLLLNMSNAISTSLLKYPFLENSFCCYALKFDTLIVPVETRLGFSNHVVILCFRCAIYFSGFLCILHFLPWYRFPFLSVFGYREFGFCAGLVFSPP